MVHALVASSHAPLRSRLDSLHANAALDPLLDVFLADAIALWPPVDSDQDQDGLHPLVSLALAFADALTHELAPSPRSVLALTAHEPLLVFAAAVIANASGPAELAADALSALRLTRLVLETLAAELAPDVGPCRLLVSRASPDDVHDRIVDLGIGTVRCLNLVSGSVDLC
jgi:hypothetical protein